MEQANENKMGRLPIGKLLFQMSVPMMISMLVQALYNVVDSMFVAQISENALAAVSLAFPLQNLMIAVGAGTGVGVNALLSRSLGEKKFDVANRTASVSMFLALCNGAVFAFFGFFLSRPFFAMQTDVAEIVAGGTLYAQICLVGSIGIFGQFCFERMLQATGRTGLAMATQLIGAVINIIMDPILIFGLLGFPKMGIAGAAAATVLGQLISALAGLYCNFHFNHDIKLQLREIRWRGAIAREVYRVGVPSIIMQAIGSVMIFGVNKILIVFSTTATAVFGIYFKLQSFVFMPVFGLDNGMIPIIAYNYGAGSLSRVKKTIRLAIYTSVTIMAAGFLTFQLIPDVLLSLFNPSAQLLAVGVPALRIISCAFMFAGFCIVVSSVCQAIGNPLHSLIVSVTRQLVVLLPVAYLLSLTGRLDFVWLAFPIAELSSLTLSIVFLRRTLKKVERALPNPPRKTNDMQ